MTIPAWLGTVALKLDAGLNRRGNRDARTGVKVVAARRIPRTDLTKFIERNEFWLAKSAEFIPHLEIREGIWS